MMSNQNLLPIVMDNGSSICRSGESGQEQPLSKFRAIIGRHKFQLFIQGINQKDRYVGDEALQKGALKLTYPMEHGIIRNWDDMIKVWQHNFYNQIRIRTSQHPILITQAYGNPKANSEKMMETMFETFEVPAYYRICPAILSLYAAGRVTGITMDIGDGVTHIVPIYEGFGIKQSIQRINLGGRELDEYMGKLLREVDFYANDSQKKEVVRDIKEKLGYVSLDYAAEMAANNKPNDNNNKIYELPDGQTIDIGSQRFRCSEALFKPSLIGRELEGVHELCYQAIMNCGIQLRKELYRNIVMSGGTTMFPGFPERFSKQITSLAPTTMKVKIVASSERSESAWIGGSILSSLSTFKNMWITKAEYKEFGASIVHRKCL